MTDPFYKQQTKPHLTSKDEPIPEFIGPYKVETLLSKGGMSWLYLGIDPETKKPLALKTLPTSHIKNTEITERFQKESQVIALTNHPNIVKLYGEGTWENGLYIAMEWVHGISLRQFLTQQSFSLKRSLDILLQVSYALEHLHSHGVIHRDLKPENILISETGEVKVIDFGIAELLKEKPKKKTQAFLGTPSYMSPEQKEDPSHVTPASDIYSLGIIAYELITGRSSLGMIQLSFLPKDLGKIIEKALAVSLSDRYQNIKEFIHDLSSYLTSESFDKEKPEQDKVREILEVFKKTSQQISPFPAPVWAFADIGIAKVSSSSQFGLYYDVFKTSPDHMFFFLAAPVKQDFSSLFLAASLRGMIRSFMQPFLDAKKPFSPLSFLEFLNIQMKDDPLMKDFALSYLYLDASLDQLTFFNAGLSSLIHIPQNKKPRSLKNTHHLLSENALSEFSETIDNWNVGDTLIYHSLIPESQIPPEKVSQMELELSEILESEALLSAQSQAESAVKNIKTHSLFSSKETQALFSIQRIG